MKENERMAFDIALNGLKRFYSEGMTEWSRKELLKLFHNDQNIFDSDYVKQKFADLDAAGIVDMVCTEAVYLVVHQKISEAPTKR